MSVKTLPLSVRAVGLLNALICTYIFSACIGDIAKSGITLQAGSALAWYMCVLGSAIALFDRKDWGRRLTLFISVSTMLWILMLAMLVYYADPNIRFILNWSKITRQIFTILLAIPLINAILSIIFLTRKTAREYFNPPEQTTEETEAEEIT